MAILYPRHRQVRTFQAAQLPWNPSKPALWKKFFILMPVFSCLKGLEAGWMGSNGRSISHGAIRQRRNQRTTRPQKME